MDSPPAKRLKLEQLDEALRPADTASGTLPAELEEDADGEHCSICLQPYDDRTMIPTCSHEFCFECLLIWTDQSRRCPLCSRDIGNYLMHHIRSKYDYQKHYLPPPRTSPAPQAIAAARQNARQRAQQRREVEWGRRRRRELEELDELERAIEKRRWVYRHSLYAKHVASNPYTRYRPFPTPAQFSASQDYISRATIFIRRELRVWTGLDVEFLTTFAISLMKSLDIRSEPAVRLLSEFLDMDADRGHERDNAEHFAHELYCYLRSPYRDLAAYDRNVQYDIPPGVPAPDASSRGQRRWHSPSHSRSRSRSRSRIRSRSSPRSPPHSRARSPGSAVYDPQDRGDHATSSQHTSRRQAGDIRRVSNGRRPSQYASADGQHSRHRSITRQSRNDRHSRSEVPHSRTNQLSAPTYSHRHRGRYDGKGKGRADDNADDSDCSSRSFTLREGSGVTSGGSEHDGISRNMENSPLSRGGGQNDIGPSALSTPPRSAGLTAAITQNAGPSSLISRVAPPIKDVDKATTPDHGSPAGGDNAQASTLQKPAMEPRQPPRARRNPWQTMQEYLSKGASGPRSSAHGDKASAAELASTPRSQVQQEAAYSPRGGALRPEDPPSSGEAVPSLLLRLSDPAPPPSASDPRLVSSGVPDAARAPLPVHEGGKGGKGISAPEIMARTRARLARMADAADQSSTTPPPPPSSDSIVQQSPGSGVARESSTTNNVAGVGDVGAVEHMSSEDGGQGKGATGPARSGAHAPALATSADPRSLLMQKLAAEKRDAADIPTAEKAQLSSRAAPRPSVPMVLPHAGSSSTRTGGGGAVPQPHSKSAPGDDVVVPAERIAERREAELRSQAQLRVRLAAAKRAAAAAAAAADPTAGSANRLAHNSQHHPDSGASGGGTGDSTATIDGDLAVHESALRERLRLKGRQAQM